MRFLLAILLLAGCATANVAPVQVWKGGDGQGAYLAGGMLLRHEGAAIECRNKDAAACMFVNHLIAWGGLQIRQYYLVVNGTRLPDFTARHLEVMVHEGSHYVWSVELADLGVPDPTHHEDAGVIR